MYKIIFAQGYEKKAKKFFKKHQDLKEKYKKTIKFLQINPQHPSLRLHKPNLAKYHSVSIDMNYRIIIDFIIIDKQIFLIDIGSHSEVY
jgi:mRNA-degrading endonuclease YafQ of YafQ-DinJ toxin-antitoxin module